MSIVRLTFLGTSASTPTLHRNVSGLAMKADTDLLLFDCGEGTQRQIIRYGTGFNIDAVFFTHFHADHYLGIIGFLRTLSMGNRETPLTLYGPPSAKRYLDNALLLGVERLHFPVSIVELRPDESVKRPRYTVRPFPVDHRGNAYGYAVEEHVRPGRFDPAAATALGVPPGPLFGALQRGETVKLPNGNSVEPREVLGEPRPGRKVVISGDTRPCAKLVEAAQGADLLVHEATFSDDEQPRALDTRHSTAREAGRVAREARVRRLVLTHFSTRHDVDTRPLLAQARQEFSGPVDAAHDGMTLELSPAEAS